MKVSNQTRHELRVILGILLAVIIASMLVAYNNSRMELCEDWRGTPKTGILGMYRGCEEW